MKKAIVIKPDIEKPERIMGGTYTEQTKSQFYKKVASRYARGEDPMPDLLNYNAAPVDLTGTVLKILHRDSASVAIEKPPGLLVHPSFLAKRDEPNALKQLRDQLGQWVYPLHRLDRPTSGVLLFGLSPENADSLAECFREQTVKKTYQAIVRGWVKEGVQWIEKPLKKLEGEPTLQEAFTEYEAIERFELPFSTGEHPTSRFSWIKVHPLTGRTHQIRRHLASASHPLIGDVVYGVGKQNRLFREKLGAHRLMLHCTELRIPARLGYPEICIHSELPKEFTAHQTMANSLLSHLHLDLAESPAVL